MTRKEYVEGKRPRQTYVLPPQGLCTCCSLCLGLFPCKWLTPSFFSGVYSKTTFSVGPSLFTLPKISTLAITCSFTTFPCFRFSLQYLSLSNLLYILIIYLVHCFFYQNVNSTKQGILSVFYYWIPSTQNSEWHRVSTQ